MTNDDSIDPVWSVTQADVDDSSAGVRIQLGSQISALSLANAFALKVALEEVISSLPGSEPDDEPGVVVIIRNAARCPICDDVVESRHRHDFQACSCGALAVDGGKDYLRRVWNPPKDFHGDPIDLSVTHPTEPS